MTAMVELTTEPHEAIELKAESKYWQRDEWGAEVTLLYSSVTALRAGSRAVNGVLRERKRQAPYLLRGSARPPPKRITNMSGGGKKKEQK